MAIFSGATGRLRVLLLMLSLAASSAHAGSGPFGIDHEWTLDQNGIWSRNVQNGLQYGVVALEVAGSLWLGNDSALGHTFWQTVDASVISGAGAQLLKYGFSRARPYQGDNPNLWFQGSGHESFPSGEVTLQARKSPHSCTGTCGVWGAKRTTCSAAVGLSKSVVAFMAKGEKSSGGVCGASRASRTAR